MFTKKTVYLFFIAVAIILIIILFLFHLPFLKDRKTSNSTMCYGFMQSSIFGPSQDSEVIDCLGYINIARWLDCGTKDNPLECGYVYVYDSYHHITFVNKVEKYFIDKNNKKIYVIGNLVYSEDNKNDNKIYSIFVPINGEYKLYYFNDQGDIPKYTIIDANNGNMSLYKNTDVMPELDKSIFQNLEK